MTNEGCNILSIWFCAVYQHFKICQCLVYFFNVKTIVCTLISMWFYVTDDNRKKQTKWNKIKKLKSVVSKSALEFTGWRDWKYLILRERNEQSNHSQDENYCSAWFKISSGELWVTSGVSTESSASAPNVRLPPGLHPQHQGRSRENVSHFIYFWFSVFVLTVSDFQWLWLRVNSLIFYLENVKIKPCSILVYSREILV